MTAVYDDSVDHPGEFFDLLENLSTLSMDTSLCYPSFHPDMENIMSVMHDLKEKNFSDDTLLSNLDFAERFLRDHPLKYSSKLLVKGDYSCVQIGKNTEKVFTVTSENNQTFVNLSIHTIEKLSNSIDTCHFFNHSCQDEFKSCFTQAQEAVSKEGLAGLHIKCNRFSVTYITQFSAIGATVETVETKCRLRIEKITAAGFLSKKVWLQKEKPTCHGLIACLDYLIKQYLTLNRALKYGYGFVIQADKEIMLIKINTGELLTKEYVLIHDHEGVSMFPPILL